MGPVTLETSLDEIDLLDPDFYPADRHDVYERFRDVDGIARDANGLHVIARHADVLDVERRSAVFVSSRGYRRSWSPDEVTMISQDDPGHLAQRRMVNRRFTPRAVRSHDEEYRDLITVLVDDALVEQAERGSIEIVDALAARLPGIVTARLLGFADEDWPLIKSWSERQMRLDHRHLDPSIDAEFYAAIHEWAERLMGMLRARSADPDAAPTDDLVADWMANGMPFETMVQEMGLLIAGGAETTRTVIAHGLHRLCERPDEWERLAAEPGSIPLAVDELIRHVTPLNNFFRTAAVDTVVAGSPIAAGDRVILLYPAANRDPAVFADPHLLDLRRDPNPHVAFGHGTHFCLGANLARLELRLLLEELTSRVTSLRTVQAPDVEPNIFARAVRTFHLSVEPR